MLHIGICDDEQTARDTLQAALQTALRDESFYFAFSSGEGLLRWLDKHAGELDLLFLDVEMPGLNGLETAKRLRDAGHTFPLAFVTGYPDFVFDGYAVGASDYLVKPVRTDKLAALLRRVQRQMEENAPRTFIVQNADGLFRLPVREILYAYSDRRRVTLVTDRREYSFYGRLDKVENALSGEFVRIHQRYLVNIAAVTAVVGGQVQLGTIALPISRRSKSEALLALSRALLETGAEE